MEKLTMEQAVILSAYTGFLICPFEELHKEVEKRLGRPVFPHEFVMGRFTDEIRMKFRDDFIALSPV